MKKIVSVSFKESGKSYSFDPAGLAIQTGDYVIVTTARGTECGYVTHGVHDAADSACPHELKSVVRMADGVDIRKYLNSCAPMKTARSSSVGSALKSTAST